MADYLSPEERTWRKAYGVWWEAATTGDWDAEHDLRMTAYDAWYDVPPEVKVGAWYRWKLSRGEVPEPGTFEDCPDANTI